MENSLRSDQVTKALETFELKPGKSVRVEVLKDLLPDPSTALFFGKLYELDYHQLSNLLAKLFHTGVIATLLSEGDQHSTSLQDYIIDIVPDAELVAAGIIEDSFTEDSEPDFLPELWEQLEVEIAQSIKDLVNKLDVTLGTLQGKQGQMLFGTLRQLNKQRQNVIGQYKAQIVHPVVPDNLVVFDVSGSMSRDTVKKIVGDVVSLAYKANAALVIVSDNSFFWEAGTFGVDDVMQKAEFNGTHYETLASVFNQHWATVVTIADYDSYGGVPSYLAQHCSGSIEEILDISLVNRPTYLSECLGQMARSVRPLLIGRSGHVLGSRYDELGY